MPAKNAIKGFQWSTLFPIERGSKETDCTKQKREISAKY